MQTGKASCEQRHKGTHTQPHSFLLANKNTQDKEVRKKERKIYINIFDNTNKTPQGGNL